MNVRSCVPLRPCNSLVTEPLTTIRLSARNPGGEVSSNIEQTVAITPAEVNTIDGVRVDWPDGFGLVRASNTTPVLVMRFEGHTPEALHRIEADMLALLRSVKPDAQIEASAH